ncbi:MAG TPA: extracellular solute-binding protein [Chloroflexota bacterium]|nr:extracellular solute-binding protein [Chloroflexota bacterium]
MGTGDQQSRGAASLLGSIGLAACGGAGAGEAKPAASTIKNASMDAWCHADTRSDWQKKTLEDYNKEKGTSHTINWIRLADTAEVANKLVVTTAAGSGFPDLADVEISQMGKLLKTPTPPLVAYNEYLKGKEADFFKPSSLDPWSLNGKYYGMGNEMNCCLFAYRYDIFQQLGIKMPVTTWDELIEVGKRVVTVAPDGLFIARTGTGTLTLFNIPAGGGYLDKGNKLILNHPNNAKALQLMADMINRHKVVTIDPGNDVRRPALNTGRIAGELGPTWRISGGTRTDAPDTVGKWMVQHLPQWSASGKKVTTTQGGTGMAVLKESKFRDVGLDFVIWEHTTKAVLRDYELRQVWPTYRKAYDDPRLNEPIPFFNNQRVGPMLKEAAEMMEPFYQGVWWPEISGAAGKHITAAMRNEKPVRQALDEAQTEAKAALEAAGAEVDPDGTIR